MWGLWRCEGYCEGGLVLEMSIGDYGEVSVLLWEAVELCVGMGCEGYGGLLYGGGAIGSCCWKVL